MARTKYWMTDGYGTAALVEGADEQDRWKPLGWSEADEQALEGVTHVWLRHEVHGGRARFPAEAVELWRQKGWQPSDPPPVSSPFNADQPADVVPAANAAPAEKTPTTEPAPAAKSTTTKEK